MKKTLLLYALLLTTPFVLQAAAPAPAAKAVQRFNKAPVSPEILKVKLPRPQELKLDNGLTLLVLPHRKAPVVHFMLWVRAGPVWEPKEYPGLAQFTAEMLKEGTATRSSAQIASEIEELGASLDTGASFGKSTAWVSASGMAEDAEKILGLLADVALKPSFSQEELDKYKKRRQSQLEEQRGQPRFLGTEALAHALYGSFPAAVSAPTPESIKNTSVASLKDFHSKNWTPDGAILAIAGDIAPDQMTALSKKFFGAWKPGSSARPNLPALKPYQPVKLILVDRPGSVQTDLFAGSLALRRSDQDYIPLTVANRVLGGGASARLFMNLREEKGYAYGASSNFEAELFPGLFKAWLAVRNEVVEPALTDLLAEIKRLREEKVGKTELEEAKKDLVAAFALSLEQPASLINYWITAKYYGLAPDYWDNYSEQVAAADPAKVQAMAGHYLAPASLQIIAVGDAAKIKSALAGFGPISVISAEGLPKN